MKEASVGLSLSFADDDAVGKNWDYLRISPQVTHEFVDQGQDIFELVLLVSLIMYTSEQFFESSSQVSEHWGPSLATLLIVTVNQTIDTSKNIGTQ